MQLKEMMEKESRLRNTVNNASQATEAESQIRSNSNASQATETEDYSHGGVVSTGAAGDSVQQS